jgi:hypothetical protein
MPEDTRLARFIERTRAAHDSGELAAVAAEIEQIDLDERAVEQLADAFREARERLENR